MLGLRGQRQTLLGEPRLRSHHGRTSRRAVHRPTATASPAAEIEPRSSSSREGWRWRCGFLAPWQHCAARLEASSRGTVGTAWYPRRLCAAGCRCPGGATRCKPPSTSPHPLRRRLWAGHSRGAMRRAQTPTQFHICPPPHASISPCVFQCLSHPLARGWLRAPTRIGGLKPRRASLPSEL